MSVVSFDPTLDLIMVPAAVTGPEGDIFVLNLVLDTGSTNTVVNSGVLSAIGYEPTRSLDRTHMLTGSGVEYVPSVVVQKISALGQSRAGFHVMCHTLPAVFEIDGVLGLDFLRGHMLGIDFLRGRISLERR